MTYAEFVANPVATGALSVMLVILAALVSLLFTSETPAKPVSPAVMALRNARAMIREARACRALGPEYECAVKEAIRSAYHFRKAAHAYWYYGE